MKIVLKRSLIFILAIISSSIVNTYYIDELLSIFNIMSYMALLLNRVALALFIYFAFDIILIKKSYHFNEILNKIFLIYMIWLIGLLFGRFNALSDYDIDSHFNFRSFLPVWLNYFSNPLVKYYIVGNILVYLPFGFFIRYYKSLIYSILYCILLIILFETLQGVTNLGYFDVDDILLNSIGGLFGIILMDIVKKFFL